ncbi:MAG: hypothetical protein RI909_809 [Bacteroidota bacterium]
MAIATQKGGIAYRSLFDLLLKENSISVVKARFEKKIPKAKIETAGKHLYKILMRSLRMYEAERNLDNRLLGLIAEIQILFNKGLTTLCFSEINRGKKLAINSERFLFYLILARMEQQYLVALQFPDLDEATLIGKQAKIKDVLEQESSVHEHSSLYELISYRYTYNGVVRSKKDSDKLNDLLLEEFQTNRSTYFRSYNSDKLHRHFQAIYFLMSGDATQSLKEFYALNSLLAENKVHFESDPIYYLYLLNGILTTLRLIKRYDDMNFFIARLKSFSTSSESTERLRRHFVFFHSTAVLIDNNKYDEAMTVFKESEIVEQQGAAFRVMSFSLVQIAIISFWTKDYNTSLKYLNRLHMIPEKYMSPPVYVLGRLLYLLSHLELHNEDHLSYSVRSIERKLKKSSRMFNLERLTLAMVNKLISSAEIMRGPLLKRYIEDVKSLSQSHPYELHLLALFNFEEWAKSKIQKIKS